MGRGRIRPIYPHPIIAGIGHRIRKAAGDERGIYSAEQKSIDIRRLAKRHRQFVVDVD